MKEENMGTTGFEVKMNVKMGEYNKDFIFFAFLDLSNPDNAAFAAQKIHDLADQASAPTIAFFEAIVAQTLATAFLDKN